MDFSAAEKERDMKFCIRVQLLSGQVFSHFGGQRSKGQDHQAQKTRIALPRLTRLVYEWYALTASSSSGGRAHFLAAEG